MGINETVPSEVFVVVAFIKSEQLDVLRPLTDEMTPKDLVVAQKFSSTVQVKTTGGSETGAMDGLKDISDADFSCY